MGKLLTVAEGGLMLGVECSDGQRPGGYFLGWHENVLHHDLVGGYASNTFDKTHQTLYLIWLYFIVYTLYLKEVDIKIIWEDEANIGLQQSKWPWSFQCGPQEAVGGQHLPEGTAHWLLTLDGIRRWQEKNSVIS